ncbi:hypothetical protein RUM44_000960 [Polyplax serrata]|uniref:Uncharacterized protein n=1 Tax=Polyplax serrata TaxID=468196 RepID=A0ABR1B931_POLSC
MASEKKEKSIAIRKPTIEGKSVIRAGINGANNTNTSNSDNYRKGKLIEPSNRKNIGKSEDAGVRLKTSENDGDSIKTVSASAERKALPRVKANAAGTEKKDATDLVVRGVSLKNRLRKTDNSNKPKNQQEATWRQRENTTFVRSIKVTEEDKRVPARKFPLSTTPGANEKPKEKKQSPVENVQKYSKELTQKKEDCASKMQQQGQAEDTNLKRKRGKPSEIPPRKTRPDAPIETQCLSLWADKSLVETDSAASVNINNFSSPIECTLKEEPAYCQEEEETRTIEPTTDDECHVIISISQDFESGKNTADGLNDSSHSRESCAVGKVPLASSYHDIPTEIASKPGKLDLEKVRSLNFANIASNENLLKLETYHQQTIATKETTFSDKSLTSTSSYVKLKRPASKTSTGKLNATTNAAVASPVEEDHRRDEKLTREASGNRFERQRTFEGQNWKTRSKTYTAVKGSKQEKSSGAAKYAEMRPEKPPTGRNVQVAVQQSQESAEKPQVRTLGEPKSPSFKSSLEGEKDNIFKESSVRSGTATSLGTLPSPHELRSDTTKDAKDADGPEDKSEIEAAYEAIRKFYHKKRTSCSEATRPKNPAEDFDCENLNDTCTLRSGGSIDETNLSDTDKVKLEIKIALEPEEENQFDESSQQKLETEEENLFRVPSSHSLDLDLEREEKNSEIEQGPTDQVENNKVNSTDLILDEETDREWQRLTTCKSSIDQFAKDPSEESLHLKVSRKQSAIKKKPTYKTLLTRAMKAKPKKKKVGPDMTGHLRFPGSGQITSVTSLQCKTQVVKSDERDCSRLARARFDGNMNCFLEDVAALNLKRRNSEPNSFKGFIWKQPEVSFFRDTKTSVSSVTSSLKHMNADDLEDFKVWEAAPLKLTSWWEMSLYHCRRPWSVLSCSVFKDNRFATSPGFILEDPRNGCALDFSSSLFDRTGSTSVAAYDVEPSVAQKNIDIGNWLAALNFPVPPSVSNDALLEGNYCTSISNSAMNKHPVTPKRRKATRSINYSEETDKKLDDRKSLSSETTSDILHVINRKSGGFVQVDRYGRHSTVGHRSGGAIDSSSNGQDQTETVAPDLGALKTRSDGPQLPQRQTEEKSCRRSAEVAEKPSEEKVTFHPEEKVSVAGTKTETTPPQGTFLRKVVRFLKGETEVNVWKYLFVLLLTLFLYVLVNRGLLEMSSLSSLIPAKVFDFVGRSSSDRS